MLLALAEIQPMKAYEFISELDRLFGPSYRASPGGVYPALTALADERLLKASRDGRAQRYELTDAGRKALEARRRDVAALEERTGVWLRDSTSLLPHLERFVARVMKVSGRADPDKVLAVLETAAMKIEAIGGRNVRAR